MSLSPGLLVIEVPVSLEPIYNEHSDRSCLCTPLSVCVSGGKTQLAERLLLCGETLARCLALPALLSYPSYALIHHRCHLPQAR